MEKLNRTENPASVVNWFLTKIPRQFHGERVIFLTNDTEIISYIQGGKTSTSPYSVYNHGLKLEYRPKCKAYNNKQNNFKTKKVIIVI